LDQLLTALKAAAEPTRLRILAMLAQSELAVGEIAAALGQSQPRVSRHIKLLVEAGLVERLPEGAWMFLRLAPGKTGRGLVEEILSRVEERDTTLVRDRERLAEVEATRAAAAEAYFDRFANDWARIRALHAPEVDVEAAMLEAAGAGPFRFMVDIGAGQGRMLHLFAPFVERAEGIDPNRKMLTIARAALADLPPGRVALRQSDVFAMPYDEGSVDLVTIHQVLHFLSDPARAVAAASAILSPGGRIVIADFAPHGLEFLREEHAHRRLGFAEEEVTRWLKDAGLEATKARHLLPVAGGASKLAVTVWTATKPLESNLGAKRRREAA
jgi:ubiquinone/menaquinone biosynthesis C-methylase UbiE